VTGPGPKKSSEDRIDAVLQFWFGGVIDKETIGERVRIWFQGGEEFDQSIRAQFGKEVEHAAAGEFDHWKETPSGRMALITLLDQFSRNIYRNTPRAFANDPKAQELCLEGLRAGVDRTLGPFQRSFFYLPLEHSEDVNLQDLSVQCFQALLDEAGADWEETFRSFWDYAVRHRNVVRRFGRFPHRNEILGRASTAEEIEFLRGPGAPF